MWKISDLLKNFFTHKDFLPSADKMPGTLFTPLHFAVAAVFLALVLIAAFWVAKKGEKTVRTFFMIIWLAVVILEPTKILWETYTGATGNFEWGGILPLYPCSIFMYAMPFAIWGRERVRYAACGYVCSLGFLGGVINFVYPANILGNYSCISFAGFHTLFYHGAIVCCALIMLLSGYHAYDRAEKWWELLLPSAPFLAVSLVANLVNFSSIRSDYMFFRLDSFIFAPIGRATPEWFSVIVVYAAYLLIHALPYLPFFVINRKKKSAQAK